MARDEQEDGRRQQLHVVEPVLAVVGGDERREQVVARRLAALLEEAVEVDRELGERLVALCDELWRQQELGVEPARERCGALAEDGVVRCGHPEQLADDGDGQRPGQPVDDVERAGVECGVQEPVRLGLDEPREPRDRPRRERPLDEAPQPRVVRWVAEEERARVRTARADRVIVLGPSRRGEPPRGSLGVGVQGVRRGATVAQDGEAVGVPGQHPVAVGGHVHRRALAELVEQRHRVDDPARISRIEVGHEPQRTDAAGPASPRVGSPVAAAQAGAGP